jgi:hypothetical protein
MEVLVSDRSRMIPAPLFRAWWIRLIERNDQHRRDTLFRIGLHQQPVRATRALVDVDDGPQAVAPAGAYPLSGMLNPDFDWAHGEVDLAVKTGAWIDPENLIAELATVTGIKAHGDTVIEPMVERLQRGE